MKMLSFHIKFVQTDRWTDRQTTVIQYLSMWTGGTKRLFKDEKIKFGILYALKPIYKVMDVNQLFTVFFR